MNIVLLEETPATLGNNRHSEMLCGGSTRRRWKRRQWQQPWGTVSVKMCFSGEKGRTHRGRLRGVVSFQADHQLTLLLLV